MGKRSVACWSVCIADSSPQIEAAAWIGHQILKRPEDVLGCDLSPKSFNTAVAPRVVQKVRTFASRVLRSRPEDRIAAATLPHSPYQGCDYSTAMVCVTTNAMMSASQVSFT